MSTPTRAEREAAEAARVAANRAIKRLDVLEWVIIAVAMVLATLAGAVVAFLLAEPLGFAFRPTWVVASLLFFVVPGAIAMIRLRRETREFRENIDRIKEQNDG